jgi:hypothetical protein
MGSARKSSERPEDKKIDVVFGVALKRRIVTVAHRQKKTPSGLVREIVNDHLSEYDEAGGVSRVILDDDELIGLVDEAAELLATEPESLLTRLVTEHVGDYLKAGRDRKQKLKELKEGHHDTNGDGH